MTARKQAAKKQITRKAMPEAAPKKILLVCPPSTLGIYRKSKVKVGLPEIPLLSVASLGASLTEAGHDARVVDLSLYKNPRERLLTVLAKFRPDYAGLTFTTPLYNEAMETAAIIKKFDPKIIVMAGGVHASTFPEEVASNPSIDIVAYGEADITIVEMVSGKDWSEVDGVCFRRKNKTIKTKPRERVKDLDTLPMPRWDLFEVNKYHSPHITSRKNPVGPVQTSRGCPFGCIYCNKNIFGGYTRFKSVKRVVDEMEDLLHHGFREIHIWDDTFNADIQRAKDICDEIVRRDLHFPWNMYVGIRVDRVDLEFFRKAKRAGCYRVGLGVESGNQELIDRIHKGIKLEQVKEAVRLAKQAGVEVVAFFMLALPGETIETMENTIKFAKELDVEFCKATITIPFPSTELFREMKAQGRIKSEDWSKYHMYRTRDLYDHENLDWDTINRYYDKFFNKLYINPRFIWHRIKSGWYNGGIFLDAYYFLKTWVME